jgi:hypothetical protein
VIKLLKHKKLSMKKLSIFFCLIFFFSIKAISKDLYSGVYEAKVKTYSGKQFVKLFLYKHDYGSPLHESMYNRKLMQTVQPIPVVGKAVIYDKGNPKGSFSTTYFYAAAYETEEGLQLMYFRGGLRRGAQGQIQRSIKTRPFTVPKTTVGSTQSIRVFDYYEGQFEKISGSLSAEVIKDISIALFDSKQLIHDEGILLGKLSKKSYRDEFLLYMNEADLTKSSIQLKVKTRAKIEPNSGLYDLENFEDRIHAALLDKTQGVKSNIIFLSNVNNMHIYVDSFGDEKDVYLFKAVVEKSSYGIHIKLLRTDLAANVFYKANQIALEEKERRWKEREIQEKIDREKAEHEAREAKKEFDRIMAVNTSTGEPTEDQMKLAVLAQVNAQNQAIEDMTSEEPSEGDIVGFYTYMVGMANKGTKIEIVDFKKYNCTPADGKPGFTCDYVVKYKYSGNNLNSGLFNLASSYSGNSITTARFSKIKGVWMLVEIFE